MPGDFGWKSSAPGFLNRDGSYRTSPSTASSIWLFVMNPGLSIVGTSDVRSKTVDSIPIAVLSPLTIASILPSISSATSSNVVGLGLPEMLALGAAIGTPAASMISAASRRDGHLTATVSSPPVVTSGTAGFL